MSLLKNSDGSDMICWHGTCANFDVFYPFSYFAADRHVSESAEIYRKVRQPVKSYATDDSIEDLIKKLQRDVLKISKETKSVKKNAVKHPDFKIIPVHLKMKNPLQLSAYEFHMQDNLIGLVWGLMRRPDENCLEKIRDANGTGDFIF